MQFNFKEIYSNSNILKVFSLILLIMIYEYVEHGKVPGSEGLDRLAFKVIFLLMLIPPVFFALDKVFGKTKKRK